MTLPDVPPLAAPACDRPPLGLIPRHMYERATKLERIQAIKEAICRYLEADEKISVSWVQEYNELIATTPK